MIADVFKKPLLIECYELFLWYAMVIFAFPLKKTSNTQHCMFWFFNLNMFVDGLHILEIFFPVSFILNLFVPFQMEIALYTVIKWYLLPSFFWFAYICYTF